MTFHLPRSGKRSPFTQIVNFSAFVVIAGISLAMPAIRLPLPQKIIAASVLFVPATYLALTNMRLFVPSLFFVINAALSPFVFIAVGRLPFQIPQIYFLLPIVLYLAVTLAVPSLRRHMRWLSRGEVNRKTVVLSVSLVVVSAAALVTWALFLAGDLSRFQEFIPKAALPILVVYGLAFAVVNSCFEEFLARAILFDGFSALLDSAVSVIVAQAVVFSAWHFHGFPGGFTGAGLVFVWSLFLGAIRYTSRGMWAPIVVHFFADLTIALILLFVLVLPSYR